MGKSQATFSKKENEKKRLKKQKDKEEKREEKKANPNKAKSFEDMIAYVDENGNLTSTPPDPKKKKVFNLEDIQVSTTRQEDMPTPDLIRKGTVTFFNNEKGYGFIKDSENGDSVFVHINEIQGQVKENDTVSFEIKMGPKGANAVSVSVIKS
jgi:cold shock CspA family protein